MSAVYSGCKKVLRLLRKSNFQNCNTYLRTYRTRATVYFRSSTRKCVLISVGGSLAVSVMLWNWDGFARFKDHLNTPPLISVYAAFDEMGGEDIREKLNPYQKKKRDVLDETQIILESFGGQARMDELARVQVKLTARERRFIKFASVEYLGQLYMTPQDFLESVTEADPRPRLKRRILRKQDIEKFYDLVPSLNSNSDSMFRNIHDKGIISYTEYLFLLSILTKPQTGFRIAFNMFDTDGNQRVDKKEFLVLEKIFSQSRLNRRQQQQKSDGSVDAMEGAGTGREGEFLQKREVVDTTILVHFFGRKGNQELQFDQFKKFMVNLQTEVLELEFIEFSKGLDTIAELDFAKILLRYTDLNSDQYDMYLDRLLERMPEERGITFPEFHAFCQFLNSLDDFSIAMRFHTLANQPISRDDFHRAVRICTGRGLSTHLVDTVYQIFDEDGDGQLSYKEFIAIMKDRIHRGFKASMKNEGMDAFKHCIRTEMKAGRD